MLCEVYFIAINTSNDNLFYKFYRTNRVQFNNNKPATCIMQKPTLF